MAQPELQEEQEEEEGQEESWGPSGHAASRKWQLEKLEKRCKSSELESDWLIDVSFPF